MILSVDTNFASNYPISTTVDSFECDVRTIVGFTEYTPVRLRMDTSKPEGIDIPPGNLFGWMRSSPPDSKVKVDLELYDFDVPYIRSFIASRVLSSDDEGGDVVYSISCNLKGLHTLLGVTVYRSSLDFNWSKEYLEEDEEKEEDELTYYITSPRMNRLSLSEIAVAFDVYVKPIEADTVIDSFIVHLPGNSTSVVNIRVHSCQN